MFTPEYVQDLTLIATLGLGTNLSWHFCENLRKQTNPDNVLISDMVRDLVEIVSGAYVLFLLGDVLVQQGGISGAVAIGVVSGMFVGLQLHGGVDIFRSIGRADKLA